MRDVSTTLPLLLHQHDGVHPERDPVSGGIEHADLALVFAGREVAKADLKAERHYAQPALGIRHYGDGRRFECLFAFPIEAHKRDQR